MDLNLKNKDSNARQKVNEKNPYQRNVNLESSNYLMHKKIQENLKQLKACISPKQIQLFNSNKIRKHYKNLSCVQQEIKEVNPLKIVCNHKSRQNSIEINEKIITNYGPDKMNNTENCINNNILFSIKNYFNKNKNVPKTKEAKANIEKNQKLVFRPEELKKGCNSNRNVIIDKGNSIKEKQAQCNNLTKRRQTQLYENKSKDHIFFIIKSLQLKNKSIIQIKEFIYFYIRNIFCILHHYINNYENKKNDINHNPLNSKYNIKDLLIECASTIKEEFNKAKNREDNTRSNILKNKDIKYYTHQNSVNKDDTNDDLYCDYLVLINKNTENPKNINTKAKLLQFEEKPENYENISNKPEKEIKHFNSLYLNDNNSGELSKIVSIIEPNSSEDEDLCIGSEPVENQQKNNLKGNHVIINSDRIVIK